MIGLGSIVIAHSNGWSCAKEAKMDAEFDMMPDKTAKRTMIVSIKGLFDVVGDCKGNVDAIFKGETGILVAFKAQMIGKGKMNVTSELNNDFETILNRIKNGITG